MAPVAGYYNGHTGPNAHASKAERDECVVCLLHRVLSKLEGK